MDAAKRDVPDRDLGTVLERVVRANPKVGDSLLAHSTEPHTTIQMTIDHPHLSIQKIEKGLKIEFSAASPQIPFEEIDNILNVSFSEANKHHIQPLDKYKFKFLKPEQTDEMTIDQIPEHFGLYIITMASDSFIYQYNPDLGENSFIVHLNF